MDRKIFCGFTDHGDLDDLIFRDEGIRSQPPLRQKSVFAWEGALPLYIPFVFLYNILR